MSLEDLNIYQISMKIGEQIWDIVTGWGYFEKNSFGMQLIKAADSIAANISEGYGRFHFKDSKNFEYYARGSLFETKTWIEKSKNRKLITIEQYNELTGELKDLGIKLNNYIKSIGKDYNTFYEPDSEY
jgi:four helix bundle protein